MQHASETTQHALYPQLLASKLAPASWWALGVQLLLGMAAGAGFIMLAERMTSGIDGPALLALLLALPVAFWVQMLVHEAGHALAGLLVGRRFLGAGVGPLRLERGDGTWMLRWAGGIRGIGGFAAMLPTGPERRAAAAVVLLGGPLANLVAAGLATLVLMTLEAPGLPGVAALGSSILAGALVAAVNLLPFRSKGWHTDGQQLRELLRDGSTWRVMQAQQLVVAAAMAGIRPRDWPAAALDAPADVPDPLRLSARCLCMSAALDRNDMATAGDSAAALAALWPGSPDGQRQGVAVMLASYAARVGDAALLAAWRPHCEGGMLDLSPYRLWLDAEAAALAGDAAAAQALVTRARAALPRVHDRSGATVLGEYLGELEGRLERRPLP